MADIINLRQARKQKARASKERQGAANRAKFGRTKAERTRTEAEDKLRQRSVDSAKIGDDT